MFAGRIGAVVMARRKRDGRPRRRRSEEELDQLKQEDQEAIEDIDIRENKKFRLYFRKIPWAHWIMGVLFEMGFIFSLYAVHEDMIATFWSKGFGFGEYQAILLMCFLMAMGLIFICKLKFKQV